MLNQISDYAVYSVYFSNPQIHYPPFSALLSTNCIFWAFLPFVKFGLTNGRHQQDIKG